MSTARLANFFTKNFANLMGVAALGGAGYLSWNSYNDYAARKKEQAWHDRMMGVKETLKKFSDLQDAIEGITNADDLHHFWRHLYFNQQLDLLKSAEDYAALVLQTNEKIESIYDPQTDEVDKKKQYACIEAYDFVLENILENLEHRMRQPKAEMPGMLLSDFISFLEALALETPGHKNNYSKVLKIGAQLPYGDLQQAAVYHMTKQADISDLFTDTILMDHLLACESITQHAKQTLLQKDKIRDKYLEQVTTVQSLALMFANADAYTQRHIMQAIETKKYPGLENAVASIKTADDLAAVLKACGKASEFVQRRFLVNMGEHKAVAALRNALHVHAGILGPQAFLYLQGGAKDRLCSTMGQFKRTQALAAEKTNAPGLKQ